MIFLGSPSAFFGKIAISEHVLTRYNRRFAKKCIDFPRFFAIRSIFRSKSSIFLLPVRIVPFTLSEAFRGWKSSVFAKRHLDVEISWLLDDFSRVPIDVFRKNRAFGACFAALQETIREKMHRFSAIFRDPEHFSLKIVDFSASGTNRLLDVVGSVPELKIIAFCKA